ncbi:hypothetical protein [Flavonifractor sp. An100]|uniref:hypothetical protein n=1 Tax=Flavonifractor sp. An100 TaxID=1965538 RepID=UPI000B3AE636|nr:hypothetical protein [Flavonifractor sp. An100]OUQ78210.1 hypothetical protein B5E43_09155 [Flavonifractor sp. An100]
MLEYNYRNEMDQIQLKEEQMEQMIQAMTKEKPSSKVVRLGGRLLVAAALCALLSVSALAASPALRTALGQLLGNFAPYSQTIQGVSDEDQGLRFQVVSALSDQYRSTVYIAVEDLTGERFTDEAIIMACNIPRQWGKVSISSQGECVSYDPETHAALFRYSQTGYQRSQEVEKLELEVTSVQPGYYQDLSGPLPEEIPGEYLETMTLDTGEEVLVPEQNPAPLEGFRDLASLSSMGFAPDGTFQVLFRLSHEVRTEREGDGVISVTPMLDGVMPEGEIGDSYFTWQGERYIGMSFVIPLSERDRLTLSNAYGTLRTQEPIRGEWKLPFTMENLPALELALSDVEGAILPDTLVLSPLGAMLLGDIEAQFRGNNPFALCMQDGSRLEDFEKQAATMLPNELYVLGNWAFPEPVDVEQVVGVETGRWYISVSGEDAGTIYPIDNHP